MYIDVYKVHAKMFLYVDKATGGLLMQHKVSLSFRIPNTTLNRRLSNLEHSAGKQCSANGNANGWEWHHLYIDNHALETTAA
jgi:hypothetical protein